MRQGRGQARRQRARRRRTSAPRRFVAVLCLAWPDGASGDSSAARSTARWSGRRAGPRGFGYDPMFLPDGLDADLRRDDGRGEAWPPSGSDGLSHRARAFARFARRRAADGAMSDEPSPASASTSTGRSARPSAPIATSTAMSATSRPTRSASPRPSPARSPTTADARPRPHRVEHLSRRRHAVADGAGDGRHDPRRGRARIGRSPRTPR